MAIVLEIGRYYQVEKNFEGWYGILFLLRIACYAGFLVIRFFLKNYFYKKQLGQYLVELKGLAQQLQ